MDDKLRQLQLVELEILDEFVRICEKNNLRYYLVGGTLLGAVRHGGFIPWDDDIDVAMPRKDYNRLAEIWKKCANPVYFYQNSQTDPYYFLSYAKIRKNGTEIYEERFKESKFHKGIFIDIFPLDYCPKPGLLCHFLFNVLAVMNYRGQVDSGEKYVSYQEISGRLGYSLLRMFDKYHLVSARKHMLNLSGRLASGQYLANYSGAYGYYKEIFSASWFGSGIQVEFEKRVYNAPANMRLLLKQLYGVNYMTIPSPEDQKTHIDVNRHEVIFKKVR